MDFLTGLRLALAVLAVFRLAQFLAYDEGPLALGQHFREWLGGYDLNDTSGLPRSALGRLSICPYCLGLWLALPALIAVAHPTWATDALLLWLGIAGAQTVLQDHSRRGSA